MAERGGDGVTLGGGTMISKAQIMANFDSGESAL